MIIEVRLFAALRKFLPCQDGPSRIDVPEGSSLGEVLDQLKVPREKPHILLRNGRHSQLDETLAPGDVVSVFPPVAGG